MAEYHPSSVACLGATPLSPWSYVAQAANAVDLPAQAQIFLMYVIDLDILTGKECVGITLRLATPAAYSAPLPPAASASGRRRASCCRHWHEQRRASRLYKLDQDRRPSSSRSRLPSASRTLSYLPLLGYLLNPLESTLQQTCRTLTTMPSPSTPSPLA